MTNANILHRLARPARRETLTHLFAVGQAVRLKGSFGTFPTTEDIYHVTGTLPPQGGSPQYRIRNDDERYERVTTQDHLEPVRMAPAGDALIERTFGHGQGTATQQSRDEEAEAGQAPA